MPHKCVECGNILEDGTDEVLDGCPECGGNKFLYTKNPDESSEPDPSDTEESEIPEPDQTDGIIEAESEPDDQLASTGKAGGKFTVGDEKETTSQKTSSDSTSKDVTDTDRVRRELMEQFETIKILEPGSYKLNLMNLYSKEERIIALEEDGRYQVMLPTEWGDED